MLMHVKEAYTKILNRLRRRTFFIRLLLTTLLAAFIPLTILSVLLIRRESASVMQSGQAQLDNAAQSVAGQFEEYMEKMQYISNKIMLAPELSEAILSGSVQNEIDAFDLIKGYREGLAFVQEYTLYIPESDSAYCATGKLHSNGFLAHYLNMDKAEFFAALSGTKKFDFVPWDEERGNIVFISPIRTNIWKEPSRYVIYVLTPNSIEKAMNTLLVDRYMIAGIQASDGRWIYRNGELTESLSKGNTDYISSIREGTRGYRVWVCTAQTDYQQNAEAIAENARLIAGLNIILCLVLIIMVACINYRPLALLVRWLHADETAEQTSELDFVYSTYTQLAEEKSNLSYQLYEKNMLIADKAMENLLSGRKITQGDLNLLRLTMPYYRIVCAKLESVENISDIIARNTVGSPIYAIEMYADGRLAFVCGCADDTEATVCAISDVLRKLLQSQTIPLGYSTAYSAPERLFMAYLEAGRALLSEDFDAPDHMASRVIGNQIYILNENEKVLEELTCAIKSADSYMLYYAEQAFAQIQSGTYSRSAQRYACYQLIEMYRRLGEAVGLEMDMERVSQLLQESSIASLKEQFLEMLEQLRTERKAALASAEDNTYSSIMQYIRENFASPDFSMNDVAEHLGVSIYTASRILKTLTGVTFRKYLNDMRVERAKELLLTTNLSVQDVSLQSGFASTSYFIKVFKDSEDTTPNNYRWNQKGQ